MPKPSLNYVMCTSPAGAHRMAYWEWGDPKNDNVLICVHGLTRTGRDFDEFAKRMASRYRVICPDIVGRGKSDWLADPALYELPQYVSDMSTLIARVNPVRLSWVGTSLGGLIALGLVNALLKSSNSEVERNPGGLSVDQTLSFEKIVLNDIGPRRDAEGLGRIARMVGQHTQFDSFSQAVDYVSSNTKGFPSHTRKNWEDLSTYFFRQEGEHWVKHYDLRLAEPMLARDAAMLRASEHMLWKAYEGIAVPLLLIRGELSDLLLAEDVKEMLLRNKHARLFEIPQMAHPPTFLTEQNISPIQQFLLGD